MKVREKLQGKANERNEERECQNKNRQEYS